MFNIVILILLIALIFGGLKGFFGVIKGCAKGILWILLFAILMTLLMC